MRYVRFAVAWCYNEACRYASRVGIGGVRLEPRHERELFWRPWEYRLGFVAGMIYFPANALLKTSKYFHYPWQKPPNLLGSIAVWSGLMMVAFMIPGKKRKSVRPGEAPDSGTIPHPQGEWQVEAYHPSEGAADGGSPRSGGDGRRL